jgi:hypothetical protein
VENHCGIETRREHGKRTPKVALRRRCADPGLTCLSIPSTGIYPSETRSRECHVEPAGRCSRKFVITPEELRKYANATIGFWTNLLLFSNRLAGECQ